MLLPLPARRTTRTAVSPADPSWAWGTWAVKHSRCLFAAHHGNSCIGPHPEEAWSISTTAHAVVPRSETAADDESEFGHLGAGDSRHHLGAVFGDAARFIFSPHHEAGDVLQ